LFGRNSHTDAEYWTKETKQKHAGKTTSFKRELKQERKKTPKRKEKSISPKQKFPDQTEGFTAELHQYEKIDENSDSA
jgi:hypothetical protein